MKKLKCFRINQLRIGISHAVDSVRYMAISLNDLPEKIKPNQTLTLNEYSIHGD